MFILTIETITEGEKVTTYTYAYDNVSNRILKTANGRETAYVYNALNQLVSDSETSYEYDLNGNLVRVIGSAHSALYEYNSENKLVKATVQNGSLVTEESYTYDYQGNRTSKTTHKSNGEFEYTKYLNDNSSLTNVLAEIDENGTVKCTYTIGDDLISQERDGKVSVYLYDGHGSVVGLANESGVVTDTYCYDAFGNLLKSTGSTENCYRYCGEQFDETTGLYYLRARYMDTATGRFISQDTYEGDINDPVSLHKYLYCSSNPVMNIDPSGYENLSDVMSASAGVAELNAIIVPNYSAVLHDILVATAVILTGVFVYLTYQLVTVIGANQIADGSTNSAEANQETRDSAIDDSTKNAGSGGGGSNNNNNDDWKTIIKKIIKRYGIDTYNKLSKLFRGKGLEIHHLIEKRFAHLFKTTKGRFPSLPLPPSVHDEITALWRQLIGYTNSGNPLNTSTASIDDIIWAVKVVYEKYPYIIELLMEFIEKYKK